MSFGRVLRIPCARSLHSFLGRYWRFCQVLSYKFALHKWEAVEETIVDGTCECGYWRAEHAPVHVLELILCVRNCVHVAGLVNGLHPNFQRVCWYLKVQVVERCGYVVDGRGIDW